MNNYKFHSEEDFDDFESLNDLDTYELMKLNVSNFSDEKLKCYIELCKKRGFTPRLEPKGDLDFSEFASFTGWTIGTVASIALLAVGCPAGIMGMGAKFLSDTDKEKARQLFFEKARKEHFDKKKEKKAVKKLIEQTEKKAVKKLIEQTENATNLLEKEANRIELIRQENIRQQQLHQEKILEIQKLAAAKREKEKNFLQESAEIGESLHWFNQEQERLLSCYNI